MATEYEIEEEILFEKKIAHTLSPHLISLEWLATLYTSFSNFYMYVYIILPNAVPILRNATQRSF